MTFAARAPNHLGDGVMALPALEALAGLGELTIAAPRWGPELYRDLPARVLPRGTLPAAEIGVALSPSLRAAWHIRRARRRFGTPTDYRRWLLTDVVPEAPHVRDTYTALAAAAGAAVAGLPRWRVRPDDPIVDVPEGHVGLNPISASGAVREWPGFGELARTLDGPVVVYGGPGEDDAVRAQSGGRTTRVGLSLVAFGRALERCALFVSNDSGAAHFARACGVPVLVLYGSTVPERSGPAGAHALVGPRPRCAPCARSWCPYDRECLRLEPARVRERVLQLLADQRRVDVR